MKCADIQHMLSTAMIIQARSASVEQKLLCVCVCVDRFINSPCLCSKWVSGLSFSFNDTAVGSVPIHAPLPISYISALGREWFKKVFIMHGILTTLVILQVCVYSQALLCVH